MTRKWLWSYLEPALDDWSPDDNIIKKDGPMLDDEIGDIVDSLANEEMDSNKPEWVVCFGDDINGRSFVIFKYNHIYADGFSMMNHLMTCAKVSSDSSKLVDVKKSHVNLFFYVFSWFRAFFKLLLIKKDKGNLRTKTNEAPRVVHFKTLSSNLFNIKSFSKSQGVTVNDVILTALAITLSKKNYKDELLSTIWMSLGQTALEQTWGNTTLAASFLHLPLKQSLPSLERLHTICGRMTKIKTSAEPFVSNWIMRFFGFFPVLRSLWAACADKPSLSFSNMVGPSESIRWPTGDYEAGIVKEVMFIVPPQYSIGLFICMMSYNGQITLAAASDAVALDKQNLKDFIKTIDDELQVLIRK